MKLAKAKVHFIGIGGIGMCGLAELLHNMGARVTGSDLSENQQTERLREMGISIAHGHKAENLGDAEVVVYSSAVKASNPEYAAARSRRIPLIPRAEALAEMMRLKRGIAVAGTHGKTTTTSLVSSVFLSAGQDPTIVVGGRLDMIKSTAQLGKGEWLIAESDESDGSFNRLSPEIVIITNIDNDHLDHYKTFENLQNAFFDFAWRIPFYGAAIVCGDDAETRRVFEGFGKRIWFYGVERSNDVVVSKVADGYAIEVEGRKLGVFKPALPGLHNALNSTAAILAGMEAGLTFDQCKKGIESFKGVDRRFQWKAKVGSVDFYDDYGHHPTEIEAVLAGFKEHFPNRKIVVAFQPHRYSRTKICYEQFLTCFKNADQLFLLDIYAAGEPSIEGVDSRSLATKIQHPSCVHWQETRDPSLGKIVAALEEDAVFVTLGAGDVWKLNEKVQNALRSDQ